MLPTLGYTIELRLPAALHIRHQPTPADGVVGDLWRVCAWHRCPARHRLGPNWPAPSATPLSLKSHKVNGVAVEGFERRAIARCPTKPCSYAMLRWPAGVGSNAKASRCCRWRCRLCQTLARPHMSVPSVSPTHGWVRPLIHRQSPRRPPKSRCHRWRRWGQSSWFCRAGWRRAGGQSSGASSPRHLRRPMRLATRIRLWAAPLTSTAISLPLPANVSVKLPSAVIESIVCEPASLDATAIRLPKMDGVVAAHGADDGEAEVGLATEVAGFHVGRATACRPPPNGVFASRHAGNVDDRRCCRIGLQRNALARCRCWHRRRRPRPTWP